MTALFWLWIGWMAGILTVMQLEVLTARRRRHPLYYDDVYDQESE